MTLTKDRVSTTRTNGRFSCEKFHPPFSSGDNLCWQYRDSKGKLHSGITYDVLSAKAEAEKKSGEEVG